jgi:hypothetical protein
MFDLLLRNAAVATMQDGSPFDLVPTGAIGIVSGMVAWIEPDAGPPASGAACWRATRPAPSPIPAAGAFPQPLSGGGQAVPGRIPALRVLADGSEAACHLVSR